MKSFRDVPGARRHSLVGRLQARRSRRPAVMLGGLLGVIALCNLALALTHRHETYARTYVGNQHLGNVGYENVSRKVAGLPVLPRSITLNYKKISTKVDPHSLGVSLDVATISRDAAQTHSWLPLYDWLSDHRLPTRVRINDSLFEQGLAGLKRTYEKQVASANLILEDGLFVLKPSVTGVTINAAALKRELITLLESGDTVLALPVNTVQPEQVLLDQEYEWEQLVLQQHVAITFYYGNQNIQLPPRDVVKWYVPTAKRSSYVLDPAKVRDTILRLGAEAKLSLTNVDQAVASVESALTAQKSLAFTLLGPPTSR